MKKSDISYLYLKNYDLYPTCSLTYFFKAKFHLSCCFYKQQVCVALQTLKALNYLKESLKIIHRGLHYFST